MLIIAIVAVAMIGVMVPSVFAANLVTNNYFLEVAEEPERYTDSNVKLSGQIVVKQIFENSVSYIGSDIFSKLKYDDLRKVHKDQTVFCVRDSDMENVPQYRTVEDYNRARDVQHIKPIERSGAQQMIEEQERILQERVRYQQYHSELSTMKYAEANKQVMASFLRLQN